MRGLRLLVKKNAVSVCVVKPLWVLVFVAFALCLYLLAASSIAGLTTCYKVVHVVAATFND
jgi:hypothetical protein